METFKLKGTLDEHNLMVTDVRFSGNSTRLATSSFDKTVKVWEVESVSTKSGSFSMHGHASIANLIDLSLIHGRDVKIFLLDFLCRQATH
mgnify:CR=1 FL=1